MLLLSFPFFSPLSPIYLLPFQLLGDVAVEHLVLEAEQLLGLARDPAPHHAPVDPAHVDLRLEELLGKLHRLEELLLLVREARVLRRRDAAEATGEGHLLVGKREGERGKEREREGTATDLASSFAEKKKMNSPPKSIETQNIAGLFFSSKGARARVCCLASFSAASTLSDMDFVDSMAAASAEAR